MASLGDRIVVLIDMDCFFCQVEAKLNPQLQNKPMAVVQYSSFGPGGIIAVNYEARDFGVTRHMRGDEAKEKCPQIELVTVPPIRGKPDTGRYRSAGKEVIDVLKKYCTIIERASVDEAYLDITDIVDKRLNTITSSADILCHLSSTYVVGYCDNDNNDEEKRQDGVQKWHSEAFDELGDLQARKLAMAGVIVEELRTEIYSQCGYRCSAGISYNKILAKLACGLHKPNRQTILPTAAVPKLYSSLPVNKVRNLGGKFGNIVMESLGCNVMADLLRYSLNDLRKRFDEKTGIWLYNIARGIDNEPVLTRLVCKSIGASKNFPGKQAITKLEVLQKWAGELAEELVDRLEQDMEENERRATSLTISYHYYPQEKKVISQSKVCPLPAYKTERIAKLCIDVITKSTQKPIAFFGMSASKFVPVKGSGNFINFFKPGPSKLVEEPESQVSTQTERLVKKQEYDIKNIEHRVMNCEHTQPVLTQPNLQNQKAKEKVDARMSYVKIDNNDKPYMLLNSADLKKTFNGENLKSSFFINILKESNPGCSNSETDQSPSHDVRDKSTENQSDGEQYNDSPDIFDDVDTNKNPTTNENNDKSAPKNNYLLQLQEIFPDFDNIDPLVLQLLPIELQREANIYLKPKKADHALAVKNSSKNSTKTKSVKNKGGGKLAIKNNSFHNFLVKNFSDKDDTPLKQCPECSQMIREEKFLEHSDFHVAQNLQKLINKSSTSTSETRNPELAVSIKRKLSIDMPKSNKKARNIQSFFT